MLNLKFLPLHFTLLLIIGIVFGNTYNISLTLVFIVTTPIILALGYSNFKANTSFNPPIYFTFFTALLFFLIGVISVNLQKPMNQQTHYINFYNSGDRIVLQIEKVFKPTKFYHKAEAKVIEVNGKKTNGRILVNIDKKEFKNAFKVDELFLTKNELKEVRKALNPNEFDYQNYLKKKSIYHQVQLKKDDYINLQSHHKSIKGISFSIRERINLELKKYNFSEEELAIINAILLGQRQDLSNELYESYKNAGAIHILAVSGLHIGIILLFLNLLLKPLEKIRKGKIIKLVLVVICLWIYAIIAGLSASVVRAVSMFTMIAIGLSINRPSSIKNSLIASMFILLLINPLYLFDVGFQLSYTAVFSIVWFHPLFKKLWKPKLKGIDYFWQILSVSFAAQLGILPLSLYYFHQFPSLFFVSSLVIIPLLGFILGFGIIIILLALLQILPQIAANFYGLILSKMNYFMTVVSKQEMFLFQDIPFSFIMLFVFYSILLSYLNWAYNKNIKNLSFILVSVIVIQIVFIYHKKQSNKTNEFIVFHQVKNSKIGVRNGNQLKIYHNLDSISILKDRTIKAFRKNQFYLNSTKFSTSNNILDIDSKKVLIVDSLGVYEDLLFKPETIVLVQSPKINLNRLIEKTNPKLIIADGSNYKSFINQWEKSCKNRSINFYNTSKNGAFEYKY